MRGEIRKFTLELSHKNKIFFESQFKVLHKISLRQVEFSKILSVALAKSLFESALYLCLQLFFKIIFTQTFNFPAISCKYSIIGPRPDLILIPRKTYLIMGPRLINLSPQTTNLNSCPKLKSLLKGMHVTKNF